MGRSVTPKYRVIYRDQAGEHHQSWNGKSAGRANDRNLEAWRKQMNLSFQPGGCNAHVADLYGFIPHVSIARIELNDRPMSDPDQEIVAVAQMPQFEVIA